MPASYAAPTPPRGVHPGQFTPPSAPPRRKSRPGMIFGGIAVAAVFGLGAGYMTWQAGTTSQVLAVARPVPYGHQITADDLAVARIAADPALSPIAASNQSSIIGQYAATNLSAGSLLTRGDISTTVIPGAGQTLVGIGLKASQMPAGGVHPQDKVAAIATPGPNDDPKNAVPTAIQAVVITVGKADDNGSSVISVQVAAGDAPTLAAWAATSRVALIVEPRG
jgi:hypothetical protein